MPYAPDRADRLHGLYAGSSQRLFMLGGQFILRTTCRTFQPSSSFSRSLLRFSSSLSFPFGFPPARQVCLFPAQSHPRACVLCFEVVKLLLQLLRDLFDTLISTAIVFLLIRSSDFSVHQCRAHILSVAQGQCAIAPGQNALAWVRESPTSRRTLSIFSVRGFPRGPARS